MNDDVRRIRKNWAAAVGASDIVGSIFYQNLFQIAPETRGLFSSNLDSQGRKLVQTLSWILDRLEDPDELVPAAQALAQRHLNYGVDAGHYGAVGEALIATLRDGLGDDFSEEDAAAWVRIYTQLSGIMIDAAYPADPATA